MPQIDLGQVVGPQGAQGEPGPQGAQGIQGPAGPAATINGVNALTIEAGDNIELSQSGSTTTLSVPTDAVPTEDSTKPVQSGGVLAALSNKAPAGFGFGDAVQSIETTSAGESYETYCAKVDAVLDGMPDKTAKLVLAYPPAVYGKAGTTISLLYKGDANYAVLSNIGSADTALCGWRMIKLKKSSSDPSAWQPFEWEHPPMQLGVEYRTVERYNGKPIHIKAVSLGLLENNTSKSVEHGISDFESCVECSGFSGPINLVGSGGVDSIYATTSRVGIDTNGSFSSAATSSKLNTVAIIKYTKTTD
ncbi:collagen-like triple helix repeat-containing protein [Dysosmobacter welbionis]|jgi:hypothetical protein|uniref:Collagen-like protein n=1 Tax=Dysosmobacter welbionis TaxID=2093857 RepID=A0A4D7AHL6_9FIRM|nr:collagen-like protein [Dysosmobacter welbionis]QCI59084.1 collagen-like protein [Dysosmobacter welbionis]